MSNKSRGQCLLNIKTYEHFCYDLCGNQKAKIYSRHTNNEKRVSVSLWKIIKSQRKNKRETKKLGNNRETINEMAKVSAFLPRVTLDVNGLFSPVKRHRVAEQKKRNK